MCFYFIGLSGSGKTTLSQALEKRLSERFNVVMLDGDEVRKHVNPKLGFSKEDRSQNVRSIGYMASLVVKAGGICICANIAPYEEDRQYNRSLLGKSYVEIYMNTPLEVCEERDVKGLYKKVRSGVIKNFTGINDPFEEPKTPDLIFNGTDQNDVEHFVDEILSIYVPSFSKV